MRVWYSLGHTQLVKIGLATGLPVVVIVGWGLLGSPVASYRLDYPWRLGLEVLILGGAAAGLFVLDRPVFAAGFALIVALNTILPYALGQA